MAKKTTNQKEPVKLREKKLSNGNISLFLDIYRNGKRHKEYQIGRASCRERVWHWV